MYLKSIQNIFTELVPDSRERDVSKNMKCIRICYSSEIRIVMRRAWRLSGSSGFCLPTRHVVYLHI